MDRTNLLDPRFLRLLEALQLWGQRVVSGRDPGRRRGRGKGTSQEFAEHRAYAHGDELKYLDWNVFARHDQLFVKEFLAEVSIHVGVLIDISPSMAFGDPSKLDAARQIAAGLSYLSLAQEDTVTLMSWQDTVRTLHAGVRGRGAVFKLLEDLSRIDVGGQATWQHVPRDWHKDRSRGVLFVLSDFYDRDGMERALREWTGRREVVVGIQILSPEERSPKAGGPVRLRDLESGETMDVTLTADLAHAYRSTLEADCHELEEQFRSAEHQLVRTWTDRPLDTCFRELMQHGGLFHLRGR